MSWVLTAFLLGHAGLSPARTVSSGAGQGTVGAGAVGALNRYHSPNDHPAHGAVSGCVIWLARPILLGMMLQDFLLPSDVPLLESWLLPISIVLAQDLSLIHI